METREVQLRAANTLLEEGLEVGIVPAPLLFGVIPQKRLRLILYQPTLGELLRMSKIIISMQLRDGEELYELSLIDKYHLLNDNAVKAMQVMIMAARLKVRGLGQKELAEWLIERINPNRFRKCWEYFVEYSGVEDFTITIRLMQQTRNLSPVEQRSQAEYEW